MSSATAFVALQPEFHQIQGGDPAIVLLADTQSKVETESERTPYVDGQANFHEACVYHVASKSIFVTSNQLPNSILTESEQQHLQEASVDKHVKLWRIYDNGENSPASSPRIEQVKFSGWHGAFLNGGVNNPDNADEIFLCTQGSHRPEDHSGIIRLNSNNEAVCVVGDFNGLPFNSVNDVIVHPTDRSIWFTDPCYGHHQGITHPPLLPNQVYRYDQNAQTIRAVADGFVRPNGLCFSPDLQTLYVTDTGAIHGSPNVPIDPAGPSHIYAFDIFYYPNSKEPYLANRRLFAYAAGKYPDGIKCDTNGNVYSGCGDGIEVWNPFGVLIGIIKIDGGVANFCFGENGVIYACNETKFWKVILKGENVKGALLGI